MAASAELLRGRGALRRAGHRASSLLPTVFTPVLLLLLPLATAAVLVLVGSKSPDGWLMDTDDADSRAAVVS